VRVYRSVSGSTKHSSTTKVGPLVPLRHAFILRHHGNRRASSYPPVPQDKVGMYAASAQGTNWLGAKDDVQDVCFFEKLPTKYRFVHTCRAAGKSMEMTGCDLNWVMPERIRIITDPPRKKDN
jgi:hypothetical protein